VSKFILSRSIIRIQFESAAGLSFSLGPLPLDAMQVRHPQMCFDRLRIEFQRLSSGFHRLWT
jgi:hypothetical protein